MSYGNRPPSTMLPVRNEIVLMGPMTVGKSSVARALQARLQLPIVSVDDLWTTYRRRAGFSRSEDRVRGEAGGLLPRYRYWKSYELFSLESALTENRDCIFDLGAGHSVYEERIHFRKAQRVLLPFRSVALLLPSPDVEVSKQVLEQRIAMATGSEERVAGPTTDEWTAVRLNAHFIDHPSNKSLATQVIYTDGLNPDDVAEQVCAFSRPPVGRDIRALPAPLFL